MIKNTYRPKNFKSIEVVYTASGGQKNCKCDPDIQPWIEFEEIYINGIELKEEKLNSFFVETFGEGWEKEILDEIGY